MNDEGYYTIVFVRKPIRKVKKFILKILGIEFVSGDENGTCRIVHNLPGVQ